MWILTGDREPMRDARVTLFSEPQTDTTDENGIAEFYDVPRGQHRVLIHQGTRELEAQLLLREVEAAQHRTFEVVVEGEDIVSDLVRVELSEEDLAGDIVEVPASIALVFTEPAPVLQPAAPEPPPPSYPVLQTLQARLTPVPPPVARTAETGPVVLVTLIAGAASGLAWRRRRR
jgi:hypothetical protein